MKHDDLIHRVSLYLDNELQPEEANHLMAEAQGNEQVRSLLDRGKSFKHFVKSRVPRSSVSPSLIRSIKEKIRVSPS